MAPLTNIALALKLDPGLPQRIARLVIMGGAVTGRGNASKPQVAGAVMGQLGHGRTMAFDEADAAGVALCHALTWRE